MMDRRELQTIWQNPPSRQILGRERVHVWRANLDLPSAKIDRLATFLSTDEIARANKFYFQTHKRKFIAARGILRCLLGKYLDISPARLEFAYSKYGKPQLSSSMGNSDLQFNVSHSHNYAVFGFGNYCLVGVDLEYLRGIENVAELSKNYFTNREFKLIENLAGREQQKTFFQLWTAKEAYLKAIGTGLSASLTSIELSCDQSNLKLLTIGSNSSKIDGWSIHNFVPAQNCIAAIVINKKTSRHHINFWNWQ